MSEFKPEPVPPATPGMLAPFNDDMIRRDDLPRDVMVLLHDLAYYHDGQNVNYYMEGAQRILKTVVAPPTFCPKHDERSSFREVIECNDCDFHLKEQP